VILTSLFQVLSRTRDNIAGAFRVFTKRKISSQTSDPLEEALLLTDMGIPTVEEVLQLVHNLKQKYVGGDSKSSPFLVRTPPDDQLNPQKPTVF